ncbi:MAG: ABC transporter permease [Proteobacteria bacterium]|nr:ABC transporter permease [Pseudomonadota bacterium]
MVWVLKRVGVAVLLVAIVVSIVCLAIRLVPGDPATLLLSQGGVAPDPAAVAQLRHQLGLDQPLLVQYLASLRGILHGDLGQSLQDGSSVAGQILQRLPRTLELIGVAAVLALATGLPSGLAAGLRPGGLFDRAAGLAAALGQAVPVFVVGTGLVLIFAQTLRWLPAGGYVSFAEDPVRNMELVAMPAVTIAFGLFSVVFRMTRASVLDIARRDFVRAARAKGLARRHLLLRHVLRNALVPVVTVVALNLGTLLGGTVLVEYVFNYPGLSGMLVQAVDARDYPEVQGIVLVISVLFVSLNLAVELIYAALDPRVRRA